MSPLEHAASLYKGKAGDFTTDLAWHLRHGVVYSGPDAFIMARPVAWNDPNILNPSVPPQSTPDTWLVWMAVGRGAVLKALTICPFPLKYAAWHRRGQDKLRRYTFDRLKTLTTGANHGQH